MAPARGSKAGDGGTNEQFSASLQTFVEPWMVASLNYVALREGRSRSDVIRRLYADFLDGWRDPATGDPLPDHLRQ